MKRHPFVLSPLPVVFLIASLALPPQSAWALRAESVQQAGGLEELAVQLAAPFKSPTKSAGLEEKKPGGWFKHNPVRLAGKLLQALVDESRADTFRYKTENSHGPLILNAEQVSRLMGGHPVPAHIRNDMKKKKYFDATLTGRVLWIVEDAFSNSLEREIPASTRQQLMELANTLKRERKFHGIQVRQARVISGRWTKERVVKALRAAKRAGLSFEPYKVLGEEQSATPKGRELKGAYKAVAQSGINQEEWHKSWGAALQSQKIPLPVNARTGQPLRTASRTAAISIYADPKLDKKGVPVSSAKPIKRGKITRLGNVWGLRDVKKSSEVVVAGLPLKKRESRIVFTLQTDNPNEVHFTTLPAAEVPSGEVSAAAWINAQGNYHTVQRAVRMDTGDPIYPPHDFILIYLDPPLLKNGLVDQQAATLYAAVGQISLELFDHPAVREATAVYAVGVRAVRKGKNNSWIFSVNNDRFHITPVGKTRKQSARLQVQLDPSVGDPLEALLIPSDPERAKKVRVLYPRDDATRLRVYPQPILNAQGEITALGKPLPETFDPGQIQAIWKDSRLKESDWVVISDVPMYKNSNGNWVFHSADKEYETGWQPAAKETVPPRLNLAFRMRDPNKRPQWARRKTGGALLYPHAGQKQFFLDDPLTDGQISPDAILFEARSDLTKQFLEHPAVAGASRLAATHYRTRTRNRGTSTMAWDPFSKKWITVGLPPKTEGSPYQLSVLFERQLPSRPLRLVRVHELITGYKVYPRVKTTRRSAPVKTLAALEQVRNNSVPPQALTGSLRQVLETGHFRELGWGHDEVADFLTELNATAPSQKRIRLVPFSGLLAEAKDTKLPPQHILRWGLNHFADSTGLEEDIDSGFYEPLAEQFGDLFPKAFQDSESIWYRWDGREGPSYVAFQLLDGFRGRHMTGIAYRYVDGEPDVQLYLWLEGIPQGPWTVPAGHFSGDTSVRPQRDAALSEMKTKIKTQLGEKRQGLVSQAAQFLYPQVLSQIRSGRLNSVELEEETSEIGQAVIRWLDLFQSTVGGSTESHGDPDSLIKLLISRAEEAISFLEQEVRDPMTRIEFTHVMEQMSIFGLLVRIAEDPAHSSNTALLERIFMLAQSVDTYGDFPGPANRIFDRWQASQNNGTAPGGKETTGLEEAEDLAPSQVEERLREVMDGYEQVTVLLSGFPPSLLEKHSLGFALPVLGPNAILYRLQPLLQEMGPSARLALEVDGGGAFTLVARFLPVQRSYPGNRSPRAIGSRLRRMAIVVLKDGAAFSTAFREFLGPGSERKFFEKENPASPIDLKETEVRALLGMAENGEPTDRQKMLLAISPSLLNVVALSVEEADKGKDRREVSPAPLNAQQVLETLERHPELRVETQIKAGPDQEPMTLDYQRIRRDEKLEAMIRSFMDNALRLAGLSQAGLEEPVTVGIDEFERPGRGYELTSPQHQVIEVARMQGAKYATAIPLPDSFTVYVQGEHLLSLAEKDLHAPPQLRMAVEGIDETLQQWDEMGFILENAGLDTPVDNPRGLLSRKVWPADLPQINPLELLAQVLARRLGFPEGALVGQMVYTDLSGQAYVVLFST